MAENGRTISEQPKSTVDKELHRKNMKMRQDEERQKKLEEMKAQVLAAQRLKEQKELERRRRLEMEDVKRQQVVERKRAINEAERDRLESIIRRNQEREARIEAKRRNERSNIVFAFGSSTPRMLDPNDMSVSFWGSRRATSTQNIAMATSSLTRRQSERDLDVGSKKRATSASGLERSCESSTPSTPAGCASGYVGRRRTDLVPTVPSRDASFTSSRKSLSQSPGRAYSMSRLDQLAKPRKRPTDLPALVETSSYNNSRPLSTSRISSLTRSMIHLAVSKTGPSPTPPTRRPLNKSDSRSMHQLSTVDGAFIVPRTTRATQLRQQKLNASSNCSEVSSRPSSSLSQQSTNSVASSASVRYRPSAVRRPRPASIAITGVSQDARTPPNSDNKINDTTKPPLPRRRKSISKTGKPLKSPVENSTNKSVANNSSHINNTSIVNNNNNNKINKDPGDDVVEQKPPDSVVEKQPVEVKIDIVAKESTEVKPEVEDVVNESVKTDEIVQPVVVTSNSDNKPASDPTPVESQPVIISNKEEVVNEPTDMQEQTNATLDNPDNSNEMTASFSKPRITTEEEAKAALAERRRLAREEAERIAEQKRLQKEMEEQAERERQQREEEQLRLIIEQQRAAEEQRLQEAIREAQKRVEEEKLRREEELRLKLQKEEQAREEAEKAEKQKAELQEKLKNEEKEREARRKRVEAIMSRTRGKNNVNSPSQQNSEDRNENKSENNKINGTKTEEQQQNGTNATKNGKDLQIVDNIIPDETVKNANTLDTITSTDSINSNNSWQTTQQFDPLM